MMNAQSLAIRLMMLQAAMFAVETAAIHSFGSGCSVMQLALIRGAAGVVLACALARGIGTGLIWTRQLPLQLLRGLVSVLYLWVMIYSFSHLPFADATAISYTQVAFIAVFSVLILGEHVSSFSWTAAAIGVAGALLISKPAFAGWSLAYVVALLGTGLNGLAFVLNRYLQRKDSEVTTMFYTNMVLVLCNAPALTTAFPPASDYCIWLYLAILLGPIGMYVGIVAVRHANAATLGPYTLIRLVISVFIGIAIYHELPDMFSVSGTLLILASCLISALWSLPKQWMRVLRPAAIQRLSGSERPHSSSRRLEALLSR
jgi:drug/metabolite transporter (DMT)-like permease